MKRILILCILLTLMAPAYSDTLTHKSGFSFWSPNNWEQETISDDEIQLSSTDGAAMVSFEVRPQADAKLAFDETIEILEYLFPKGLVVESEPESTTLNGLEVTLVDGSGETDGREMRWALEIAHYEDKIVVVVALCYVEDLNEHGPDIEKIMDSVK